MWAGSEAEQIEEEGRGVGESFPGCTHTIMIQLGVQFKRQII